MDPWNNNIPFLLQNNENNIIGCYNSNKKRITLSFIFINNILSSDFIQLHISNKFGTIQKLSPTLNYNITEIIILIKQILYRLQIPSLVFPPSIFFIQNISYKPIEWLYLTHLFYKFYNLEPFIETQNAMQNILEQTNALNQISWDKFNILCSKNNIENIFPNYLKKLTPSPFQAIQILQLISKKCSLFQKNVHI